MGNIIHNVKASLYQAQIDDLKEVSISNMPAVSIGSLPAVSLTADALEGIKNLRADEMLEVNGVDTRRVVDLTMEQLLQELLNEIKIVNNQLKLITDEERF